MKRSNRITLQLLASVSVVAGVAACDEAPPPARDVAVTSAAYANAAECQSDGNTAAACQQLTQLVATAPKFDSQQSCEAQFGPQACAPQQSSGGGSFFVPMMMGYMLGSLGNGGSYNYDRDYDRYRGSSYYNRDVERSRSGYYNQPRTSSTGQVVRPPRTIPVAVPVASQRGGFGQQTTSNRDQLNTSTSRDAINRGSNYTTARVETPKSNVTRGTSGSSSRGGFGGSSRGFSGGG
jgi:uncharacterized protein YgiB involved in biofilm formation